MCPSSYAKNIVQTRAINENKEMDHKESSRCVARGFNEREWSARPPQDRSLLLLIALIDLMRTANAASGEMRSRVYLLLMRPALAPASDAPVIEGTPFN